MFLGKYFQCVIKNNVINAHGIKKTYLYIYLDSRQYAVVGFMPRPFYSSSHVIEGNCNGQTTCNEDVANSSYPSRKSKPGSHYLIEVSLHYFRNVCLCFRENFSPYFRERSKKLSRNLIFRTRKAQCEQKLLSLFPYVTATQRRHNSAS